MSKKLSAGKYKVGIKTYDSSETTFSPGRVTSTVGVFIVRGDVINESTQGFLGGVWGANTSKWYILKMYSVAARERGKHGDFVRTGSIQKEIGNMVEKSFDSKKDAEEYIDRKIYLDEQV